MNLYKVLKNQLEIFYSARILNLIKAIYTYCQLIHDRNIVHRDIKLENIIYDTETQRVAIIDFGFSIHADTWFPVDRGNNYHDVDELIYSPPDLKNDIHALGSLTRIIADYTFKNGDLSYYLKEELNNLANDMQKPIDKRVSLEYALENIEALAKELEVKNSVDIIRRLKENRKSPDKNPKPLTDDFVQSLTFPILRTWKRDEKNLRTLLLSINHSKCPLPGSEEMMELTKCLHDWKFWGSERGEAHWFRDMTGEVWQVHAVYTLITEGWYITKSDDKVLLHISKYAKPKAIEALMYGLASLAPGKVLNPLKDLSVDEPNDITSFFRPEVAETINTHKQGIYWNSMGAALFFKGMINKREEISPEEFMPKLKADGYTKTEVAQPGDFCVVWNKERKEPAFTGVYINKNIVYQKLAADSCSGVFLRGGVPTFVHQDHIKMKAKNQFFNSGSIPLWYRQKKGGAEIKSYEEMRIYTKPRH